MSQLSHWSGSSSFVITTYAVSFFYAARVATLPLWRVVCVS